MTTSVPPRTVVHICRKEEWQTAQQQGAYSPASVTTEGFIHCSLPDQVVGVANSLYRGEAGLVLLMIDSARLTAPIVFEDCYESGTEYPHLYGALNIDAVVEVVDFPSGPDGSYSLPRLLGRP